MTCAELMNALVDYLSDSGELVVEVRETYRLHIDGCPKCGPYVASYSHTIKVSRLLPRCALPPAFEARLRKALEPELGGEKAGG
jgi:hypothetical protein